MASTRNRLSRFLQDLKRRNVHRLMAVYGGTAFIIFEASTMIFPRWGLPDWTIDLMLYLLILGAIITFIIGWIYDIHPEGGIVKTEPADKVKPEELPKSSSSWKIASYISFIVIVGLIILNIIPRANNNRKALEKSIAVLPLDYLSDDPEKEYLANGVLDAITGHLSMIEGLRVMPRTSVEQYRETIKSAKEIGEELDVSYLIEGSFLMIEDQVKLTIQLVIAGEGDHLFFNEYDRNYEDILVVQSEVAQKVAREIEIAITPSEKQRIEKVPTTSLTAHDFYLRGREEQMKAWLNGNNQALERAENLFNQALDYDSTYAMAYTGLAFVFWAKQYWNTFFSEDFIDSVLIFADLALTYNDQLSTAYTYKGNYYRQKGRYDKAIEEFDRAIQLNPNDWEAYVGRGWIYFDDDFVKAIENFHRAADLNRGQHLPILLRRLSTAYSYGGFWEKAIHYQSEALKLDADSSQYFAFLGYMDRFINNSANRNEYYLKAYALDTNNTMILPEVGNSFMSLQQYEEAVKYYQKYLDRMRQSGFLDIDDAHRIGYAFLKNGFFEKAEYYFNMQLEYCLRSIELNRFYAQNKYAFYDLAAIYAMRGDKEKAIENLHIFNQREIMPVWASDLRGDPLFDNIKDEPEYQQILEEATSKYHAEHDRVRQWLDENDIL